MAQKSSIGGADGKKGSKAAAYRDSEKVLGETADLGAVRDFLLKNHNIDMKKTQVSQYRSNEKKRQGRKLKKRGRKPKSLQTAATTSAAVSSAPKAGNDPMVDFVSAMRSWENKIGSEKICDMIEALYKRR